MRVLRGNAHIPGCGCNSITAYILKTRPELIPRRKDMAVSRATLGEIATFSSLTCVQQSVMNFGILMVQGLVNSFGMA